MQLKDFTPAYTLMLTKPSKAEGTELLKYAFLDLVYRGILKIYQEWRLPHARETQERLYTLISRGPNFQQFTPSEHQNPFIELFVEDDYEYHARGLVKKVAKNYNSAYSYKVKSVYADLQRQKYFNSSFGFSNVNMFFLSKKGKEAKETLNRQLRSANKKLPKLVEASSPETQELLNQIGSNVLLLDCFTDELMEKLKPLLNSNLFDSSSDAFESFDDDIIESFFYTFDNLDISFDSFDDVFDFSSFDVSVDAGGGFDVDF